MAIFHSYVSLPEGISKHVAVPFAHDQLPSQHLFPNSKPFWRLVQALACDMDAAWLQKRSKPWWTRFSWKLGKVQDYLFYILNITFLGFKPLLLYQKLRSDAPLKYRDKVGVRCTFRSGCDPSHPLTISAVEVQCFRGSHIYTYIYIYIYTVYIYMAASSFWTAMQHLFASDLNLFPRNVSETIWVP